MLGTNQGDTDMGAYFFYESSGESILREESLREICQLETRFFTNPRYPGNCERRVPGHAGESDVPGHVGDVH